MVMWDKWTIFVTIFGGQEMLADCCENICVFVKIYREHLRKNMGKKKDQKCHICAKWCDIGENLNYFQDFFAKTGIFWWLTRVFYEKGNLLPIFFDKKIQRKFRPIEKTFAKMETGSFVSTLYRGWLFKFPLESEGTKRIEEPSYRGQLHNNSNLILELHLFAIWA